MKRLFLSLALALITIVLASPAFSQGMRWNDRVDEMKTKLSLTDEQVEKVKAVYDTAQQDIRKAREEGSGDRQELMMYARDRMNTANEAIKPLLTDEQLKLFDDLLKEWRERAMERMRERRGQM